MITVDNLKILQKLPNHEIGEVAYVTDEKKAYTYQEDGWTEINDKIISEGGLKMNLYELNKSIITQQEPLDDVQIGNLKDTINAKFSQYDYSMLYGKEISYFTLFKKENNPKEDDLGQQVLNCLSAVSDKIYSFEFVEETNALEIWCYNTETDLATVLYLFDYTEGVVPFNG